MNGAKNGMICSFALSLSLSLSFFEFNSLTSGSDFSLRKWPMLRLVRACGNARCWKWYSFESPMTFAGAGEKEKGEVLE